MPARVQSYNKSNVSMQIHQGAVIKLSNITMRAHFRYSNGHKSTNNVITGAKLETWGRGEGIGGGVKDGG